MVKLLDDGTDRAAVLARFVDDWSRTTRSS